MSEHKTTDAEPCDACRACLDARDEWAGVNPMNYQTARRMVVCVTCGNKRCPKATDHRLACTGSNAAGQAGSVYA